MARGDITVRILGETRDLERKLNGLTGKGGSVGRIGGIAKAAGVGFAVLGGAAAVGAKKAVDAFTEAEAVGAQTSAAIKSTGGAARVSQKHVEGLANKLSLLSAKDDEAIQSSQNLLLTFTNIRNEVGKGNDIFDQASLAVLDLSQRFDQDLKTSSIQLGKALNDPVKGVTALSRAGIQFTKQQKDQIAALVESGDVLGAQKLIIDELNKQVGGSAEAFGKTTKGGIEKAKVSFENALESIGAAIAPVVTQLLGALGPLIPVLGDALVGAVTALSPVLQIVADALADILPSLLPIIEAVADAFVPVLKALLPALKPVIKALAKGLVDAVVQLAPVLGDVALVFADLLVALAPLLPPLIKLAVLGMKPSIFLLQLLAKILTGLVIPVLGWLVKKIAPVIEWVAKFVSKMFEAKRVKEAWENIKEKLGAALQWIKDRFNGIVDFVKNLPGRIATKAKGMWNGIVSAFKGAINTIIDAWNRIEFRIPGFDPPGPGPKFKGFTLGLPNIPRLAEGGIVSRPTLALVGESGPEAVIPLGRKTAGNVTYITYEINVDSSMASSPEVGKKIVEHIRAYERGNGPRWRAS